jgi:hypothetical protein
MDDKDRSKEYWEQQQIKLKDGGPLDLNKGIAMHKEGDSDWEKFKDFQDKLEAKLWYPAKWEWAPIGSPLIQWGFANNFKHRPEHKNWHTDEVGTSLVERLKPLTDWYTKLKHLDAQIKALTEGKEILILKSRRAGYRSQSSMKLIELHLELDEHLAKVYKIEKK